MNYVPPFFVLTRRTWYVLIFYTRVGYTMSCHSGSDVDKIQSEIRFFRLRDRFVESSDRFSLAVWRRRCCRSGRLDGVRCLATIIEPTSSWRPPGSLRNDFSDYYEFATTKAKNREIYRKKKLICVHERGKPGDLAADLTAHSLIR